MFLKGLFEGHGLGAVLLMLESRDGGFLAVINPTFFFDSTFGLSHRGANFLLRRLIGFTFVQNSYKGCGCLRDQSKNPVTTSLYERDDKDCIDSPWRN